MHSDGFSPRRGQVPVEKWQLFPNLSKLAHVARCSPSSEGARSQTAVPAKKKMKQRPPEILLFLQELHASQASFHSRVCPKLYSDIMERLDKGSSQ